MALGPLYNYRNDEVIVHGDDSLIDLASVAEQIGFSLTWSHIS